MHRMCAFKGCVQTATVVHHVIPHKGNLKLFWSRSNWQALCQHHHNSSAQSQEKRTFKAEEVTP